MPIATRKFRNKKTVLVFSRKAVQCENWRENLTPAATASDVTDHPTSFPGSLSSAFLCRREAEERDPGNEAASFPGSGGHAKKHVSVHFDRYVGTFHIRQKFCRLNLRNFPGE